MRLIENFDNWNLLNEADRNLESFLNSAYESALNENIGAALGSPIKYMKLKKTAKEYQSSLVQKAINNLDFEKKKAAGNLDPKQNDVLLAANKQKNQALSDKATALSQKMDSLATTDGLKAVASIAKNKSQLAAAEIAAKTADGEEAKALKLKIQGLNKKVAASQEELEDYKKDAEDSEQPEQQNLDNVKSDPKKGGPAKTDGTETGGPAKTDGTETEDTLTDDQKNEIRSKIEKIKAKIASGETKKEGKPEDIQQKIEQSLADKRKELEDLEAQLGESFGSYEKTMAILIEMESNIDAVLREYNKVKNTSSHYVSESIATRFKRAMDQRGPRF